MRKEEQKDETDIFQKEYIEKIFALQTRIVNSVVTFQEKNYTVDDLCYKPITGKGCMITSPTNFWKEDIEAMRKDPDVKETAKCLQTGTSGEMPCFDAIGTPIQINAIFGVQGCEGNIPISECTVCNKTARSMSVTFMLNNDFYLNKIAEEWEQKVFQQAILDFNAEEAKTGSGIKVYYMMERSVPDELELETQQNMNIIAISYLMMFAYIIVMMGEFPSIITSRFLVGLGGILVVILSVLSAFAITSALGIKQTMISLEVVPFLVLAIGVDNMFIISTARDRQTGDQTKHEYLIGLALKEVGPSITTAACGEFLTFLVGYLTDIPALESFCLCASSAVLVNYFLQMTMFVSFLTFDDMRIKSGRYDLLPCLKIGDQKQIRHYEGKRCIQSFLGGVWFKFISNKCVHVVILILYFVLTGVSLYSVTKFPLGLNQQTTVTENGDLYNYFGTQEKYVDLGSPGYLVFYNIDYNNEKNLQLIDKMSDHLATMDTIQPPVFSWYKDFQKFMNPFYKDKCNKNLDILKLQPLASQVREFLKMKTDHVCCTEEGICGEQYLTDIAFTESGDIEASRFRYQHVPLINQEKFVNSVLQTNAVCRLYENEFTLMEGKTTKDNFVLNGETVTIPAVFPYSLFYVYYDQYLFIRGITVQNLFIGFATIFLAVQLVMNIKSAAVVILFCFSTVVHLIGVLWLSNLIIPGFIVELNAVSAVNLFVALGLSVEFCTHIIIFYTKAPAKSTVESIKYSLTQVGGSVLLGVMTTKIIGILVLLTTTSQLFPVYYFRMYFCLILVGFINAFICLPIFLMYVNIKNKNASAKVDDNNKKTEALL